MKAERACFLSKKEESEAGTRAGFDSLGQNQCVFEASGPDPCVIMLNAKRDCVRPSFFLWFSKVDFGIMRLHKED